MEPGMVVQLCNPSTQKLEAGGCRVLQASLSYMVRPVSVKMV